MEKESQNFSPYSSSEFQFFGKKAIEICQEYDLDENGIKIVDEVLIEWSRLIFKQEEKMKVMIEKIKDYPNRSGIIQGVMGIILLWLEEHPRSPVGKFARKTKDN
jgi:hypothetical protein